MQQGEESCPRDRANGCPSFLDKWLRANRFSSKEPLIGLAQPHSCQARCGSRIGRPMLKRVSVSFDSSEIPAAVLIHSPAQPLDSDPIDAFFAGIYRVRQCMGIVP